MGSPRICLSVAAQTTGRVLEAIRINSPDIYEVRLDYRASPIDLGEVRAATDAPLIATNRGALDDEGRVALLIEASAAGFDYVDLEAGCPALREASREVRVNGSRLIVSHHDACSTPTRGEMDAILRLSHRAGGAICKIVGTATSPRDNLAYLGFTADNPGNVCFGMGPLGVPSRILGPLVGGAFTYASTAAGEECAPGQLTLAEMREVYRLMGAQG